MVLLVAFALTGIASFAQPPLDVGEMSLTLVTSDGSVLRKLDSKEVRLVSSPVTVQPTDSVSKLLRMNGVYPNGDAFTLVYELNPKIEKLSAVGPGTTLVMPKWSGGPAVARALRNHQLVSIASHGTLKGDLKGAIDRLRDATRTRLDQGSVREVLAKFELVRKAILTEMVPFTSEALTQLRDEAELLLSTLGPGTPDDPKGLDADEQRALGAILDDLVLKTTAFEEVRGPRAPGRGSVRVSVRVRDTDGNPVQNLRIYYVLVALYQKRAADTFTTLTTRDSSAAQYIPVANYYMWAGRGADPQEVSGVLTVKVRDDGGGVGALPVDLSLKR